jgi:hypothetical protein
MPNAAVAVGAINLVAVRGQVGDQRRVAADTVVLDDRQAAGLDLDRLVKILKREAVAVPQAVLDFRRVFA